ncbi:hypothetical protein KGQ64_15780, partial [bacterium]|nr:hypothetical protein [bacterium]
MTPTRESRGGGPSAPTAPPAASLEGDELVPESGISTRPSRSLGLLAAFFALAALGLMFLYSDGRALLEAARNVSWLRLLVPIGLTLLSYVLMALSYE